MNSGWWRASLVINRALCGNASEPLCSRVHRQKPARWRSVFMFCADIAFGEADHCAKIHRRWKALKQENSPC